MKLKIVFKYKFEEHMKKQFGSFTNPQVFYGVQYIWKKDIYAPRFQTQLVGVWTIFPDFTVRRTDNG